MAGSGGCHGRFAAERGCERFGRGAKPADLLAAQPIDLGAFDVTLMTPETAPPISDYFADGTGPASQKV
jgi:hypothetical protein